MLLAVIRMYNTMRKILHILLFCTPAFLLNAQSVKFEKANFPNKKDEFKEAIKKLDIGTDLYEQGRKEFDNKRRGFLSENRYLPMSHHDHHRAGYEIFRTAL